jgi:hypothetical protein
MGLDFCAVSGYCSNELSSVNMLPVRKFCSGSRTSEKSSVLVYRVNSVRTDDILMWVCEMYIKERVHS